MGKEAGEQSEQFFRELLAKTDLDWHYINGDYDFKINDLKVEVKSCTIGVKDGPKKKEHFRPGRFDFTNEDNLKMIREEGWVVFILRHKDSFLFLGFVNGKEIPDHRYIPLHHLRKFNLLTIEEFKERIKWKR